ncbi:peptidase domain-containing ABC transporter [Lactococcus formosensis]|uniref:peptidase domain-containing ABC transporter n=1 Tax=Lactococcus formosensis TaxID=1281486 RepID=UPI0032486FBD
MKVRFQQQSEHSECGLACATMMIDYFVKKVNIAELREKYGVPNGGYNLFQMGSVLKEYGVVSKAARINAESVQSIPTPFIAFWDLKHFVVIEKIIRKTIHVVDPALGKRKLSFEAFKEHFSEVVLYSTNDGHRSRKISKINNTLKESILENKNLLVVTFSFSLLSHCVSLLIPFVIQSIIDSSAKMPFQSFLIGIILMIVSYFVINMVKIRLLVRLQTRIDKTLLGNTIHQLLHLPYSYFVNRSKGELIYRINSNSYIRQILVDQVLELALSFLFLVVYIFIMFWMNIFLALITIIIVSILIGISIINAKINQKIVQNQMVVMTKSQDIVNEMINNIFTVKATSSYEYIYKNWSDNFGQQIIMERTKAKYSSILTNIPNSIQSFYPLIIFFFGYLMVQSQEMTLGTVVAFSSIGVMFLTPVLSITNVYNQLLMIKVYIDRLLDILETKQERDEGEFTFESYTGKIDLENVTYRYSRFSEAAIKNVSLSIQPHQKLAIVGASGSGKSTLLKVMASLFPVESGKVYYDDVEHEKIVLKNFRKNLGIVLQENILFSGTFRENILMGRKFTDDELLRSIQIANLDELVALFPLGVETKISENGQNFSGGQRQRISIARTVISQPKAIFMDEPTSGLDNITEKNVMANIFKLPATVIIVAHRLSMIAEFDQVIVMGEGKIVGKGMHQELLETCQEYQKLYKISEN